MPLKNHTLRRPLKKAFTDEYDTLHTDAVWIPFDIHFQLDDRIAVVMFRCVKSGEYYDNGGKCFAENNAIRRLEISGDEYDLFYRNNFQIFDPQMQLIQTEAKARIPDFADATPVELDLRLSQ